MANWKDLKEMTFLGKSYTRVEAPDKVTGKAKYTYDIQFPGMLFGKILRSPHPHAKIASIDAARVNALPGVKAVITDLRKDEVFYAGDDVAAVAAETEEIAQDAIKMFDVKYDLLGFVVDEQTAMKEGADKVFSNRENNIGDSRDRSEGDIEKGFQDADEIIERTYHMNVQVHTALETHGCVAKWEGDELHMWDSTQGVQGVRSALARHFEIAENKVHVHTDHMGGGFGSKLAVGSYNTICAHLARMANAPVKLMLDREEEMLCTGNRPSSTQKIKIGAKKDGTLTAFQSESYGTGGIGGGAGVPQPYIYHFPNWKISHKDVFINAGPGAPMRAPGHPQANFAMESAMDELAEKIGIDPLEFRMKNDSNETRKQEYKIGAENIGWSKRQKSGSGEGIKKRGFGLGSGRWGGGGSNRTAANLLIFQDGTVEVKIGTQDIGTGTRTIITGVVAEELGLELKDITTKVGNTDYPWGPASGGSTTAASVGPTAKLSAEKAKQQLIALVAGELQTTADDVELANKEFRSKSDSAKKMSWKEACHLIGGQPISVQENWQQGLSDSGTAGCQFAEVDVDTETGEVRVVKMIAVQDCGLVLNMLTAKNQVQGGIIGEIGYSLLENRILDNNTGVMVNSDMENYKIPGAFEMPEFDVTMFDESKRGVIGIGEPPAIPGVGAIANAIANAIGVRVYSLPITPDKVLMALANRKEG